MFCKNCGSELADGSMFCQFCGSSMDNDFDATVVVRNRIARKEHYNFVEAIKSLFSNYGNFKGRATKSEYWWAFLFLIIVNTLLSKVPVLGMVVALALFIPNLSLNIRRLHDVGKSGWFLLMGLIPLAGFIILIVQYCKDPVGDNQWGVGPAR